MAFLAKFVIEKNENKQNRGKSRTNQCDQIWWNFAILQKLKSLWVIFKMAYLVLANFCTNLGIIMHRGKLSLLQMAKDWIVI